MRGNDRLGCVKAESGIRSKGGRGTAISIEILFRFLTIVVCPYRVEYWSEIKVYQSFAFPLLNNSFSLRFLSDIFSRIIAEECSCDFLSYCSFVVIFE